MLNGEKTCAHKSVRIPVVTGTAVPVNAISGDPESVLMPVGINGELSLDWLPTLVTTDFEEQNSTGEV